MALKKVPLRKIEDGIPNQALREIKALQEIGGDCEEAQNGSLNVSFSRLYSFAQKLTLKQLLTTFNWKQSVWYFFIINYPHLLAAQQYSPSSWPVSF